MDKIFEQIKSVRKAFIDLVDDLGIDAINNIPDNYNNNVIWNFGHIVVSTSALCYFRSGVDTDTSRIKYFDHYIKGSKPTYFVSQEEVEDLKTLAFETIDRLEEDYSNGIFRDITPFYTSTYKVELRSIEDIIITSLMHDSHHLGFATAQRKFL